MTAEELSNIRDMMDAGMTDAEIAAVYAAARADVEHEEWHEREEREDRDFDDPRSYREIAMCDRLDMGRNEAGEWLGFM
jgi:hypothetical protein